eukprot:813373-Alexandrium_andersonii.AAC.1
MARLRAAMVRLIDPGAASSRSADFAFEAAGTELDPEVVVVHARVRALRRAWALFPWLREPISRIWNLYFERSHPGCAGALGIDQADSEAMRRAHSEAGQA